MAFQMKSIIHELIYFPPQTLVSQLIKLLLALTTHMHVDALLSSYVIKNNSTEKKMASVLPGPAALSVNISIQYKRCWRKVRVS